MGKITINTIAEKKRRGEPIVMITAYDYPGAKSVDEFVDITLVGDSLGMVILGYDSTVPVSMEEMLHHCRAVARGTSICFTIGDMPFGSYEVSREEAIRNAARFLKEGMMEAVKLEGGQEIAQTVKAIVDVGISVMGHIGLTPQSASKLGGYRVQGNTAESARRLLEDALALERAGCFALVLEAIPAEVASIISSHLKIPAIGIGSGAKCDGQVLVLHDLVGWTDGHVPRFVRQYASIGREIQRAIEEYRHDVQAGQFPTEQNTYPMKEIELNTFLESLNRENELEQ